MSHIKKDFSNPHKLGFMRWLELWYLFSLLLTIAGLMVTRKELGAYDGLEQTFNAGFDMVFAGLSLWLLWTRKRAARAVIVALNIFDIAQDAASSLLAGEFDLSLVLIFAIPNIITIIYMLTSRRVRAVLIHPFDEETKRTYLAEHDIYQPRTWAFWRNLIIYFCVFSVVGHWMEAAYCTLIRFGIIPGIYDPNSQIWSDWFYPFCVYGFGAVACVLIMYPIKRVFEQHLSGHILPFILSFIVNALICSGIELAMGLMLNTHYELWDYRNMLGNFLGQICLQNALAFGAVATLMTWVIYPVLEAVLARFSASQAMVIFIVTVVIFSMLFTFYCINVLIPGFNDAAAFLGSTNLASAGSSMGSVR